MHIHDSINNVPENQHKNVLSMNQKKKRQNTVSQNPNQEPYTLQKERDYQGMYFMENPSSTLVRMTESGTFLLSSLRISARGLLIPEVGTSFSGSVEKRRTTFPISDDHPLDTVAAPLLNVHFAAFNRNPNPAISFAGQNS